MLKLRKYLPQDADIVVSWLKDELTFYQWSADKYSKFPICADDINEFYGKNDFYIFCAVDENDRVVGHFILRYPDKKDKSVLRLGFVIVDDSLRGKGIGKQMLLKAIEYSFERFNAKVLELGVFENNSSAYHCYKACGFEESGFEENGKTSEYKCNGELWNCIEMQITLKKYKQIFEFI